VQDGEVPDDCAVRQPTLAKEAFLVGVDVVGGDCVEGPGAELAEEIAVDDAAVVLDVQRGGGLIRRGQLRNGGLRPRARRIAMRQPRHGTDSLQVQAIPQAR
jgi:hypothetical protein